MAEFGNLFGAMGESGDDLFALRGAAPCRMGPLNRRHIGGDPLIQRFVAQRLGYRAVPGEQ